MVESGGGRAHVADVLAVGACGGGGGARGGGLIVGVEGDVVEGLDSRL